MLSRPNEYMSSASPAQLSTGDFKDSKTFFSVRARVERLLPSVALHIFKAVNLCSFKIGDWEDGTIHPDETA